MVSQSSDDKSTRGLLETYYERVEKKGDFGSLLSDGFLLTGTVAKESRGRKEYVNNGFFRSVQNLQVKHLIAEGSSALAIVKYDLKSPKGTPFTSEVAEFWSVRDGQLDSVSIYFDTASFSLSMSR